MNVIVDTSSWIAYFRGDDQPEIEEALQEGRVFLPPLVVAELMSGRLSGPQQQDLRDFLSDLPMCEASFEHWSRVGQLRTALSRLGLSISTPDAHVAQCCLDLEAMLFSEDRIFRRVARHRPVRVFEK